MIIQYSVDFSSERFGEVVEQLEFRLKCRELLRPEEIKGNNYTGGRNVYCGDRELYRTNSFVEILTKQVKSSFSICSLQDYHSSKGFLLRQTYDMASQKFFPELSKVCLCQEHLNPDLNFFICPICNVIYHNSCVGEYCPDCKLPIKRQSAGISEIDSPSKISKPSRQDNTLPLDVEKYKSLSNGSRVTLLELIKNVHMNYLAVQGSLNNEDKTRQQIIEKIKCALLLAAEEAKMTDGFEVNMHIIESLSISVEAAIYFSTGKKVTSQEYAKKIRSLTFNLMAEKNPDFRGSIIRGEIDPKDLCNMQSKDMASSEIKNFRQERQKVYTKEQLILPNSAEKLMVKTHKGEAVFERNDKTISDEFTTDILDSLNKKREADNKLDDDDPFNPNNYESIDVQSRDPLDSQIYEMVKEWTPQSILHKIKDRICQHLTQEQSLRILSRINSFSLNKIS